jgi:hypothetical protein
MNVTMVAFAFPVWRTSLEMNNSFVTAVRHETKKEIGTLESTVKLLMKKFATLVHPKKIRSFV